MYESVRTAESAEVKLELINKLIRELNESLGEDGYHLEDLESSGPLEALEIVKTPSWNNSGCEWEDSGC